MASKEPEQLATDDAIVLMFLTLVEEDGMEVPITLNVNGAVISGTLVGASTYYEGVTKSAEAMQDSTMSKIISKKLNDLKEAYIKQKQEDKDDKEDEESSPTFIHLKDAAYIVANGQSASTNSGTWWRGRISSVDGFSFNFLV
ncbi:MAG TPA: gas vesicle accessory protein GvpU [Bacillus sp. (in: firmicutes)]|nr:gas vesicle accessory protein GvpU [Bacillus sp. (in: firmicutes)]